MIDREIKCQWCEAKQEQSGQQYLGFGFNMLSYKCTNCKGVAIFARNTNKEIVSLEIKPEYKQ